MKRLKLLLEFSLLLLLSVSLSGCIITSASPDPKKTLYLESGESKLFQFRIEGPAETDLLYYRWRAINGNKVQLKWQNGNHEFEFQPEFNSDITNKIIISCDLLKVVSYQFGEFGWSPLWTTTDSKSWEINIIQDPPIWNGDYIAEDQEDLQLLNGFTEITGDLNIVGKSSFLGRPLSHEITSLEGLNHLETIGGDLYILLIGLTDLQGLNNLSSIGGDMDIIVSGLTSLDGLSSIFSIGGYLAITANSTLKNLQGLSNLTSVGEYLYIGSNNALTSLDGLNSLTSIGEGLLISKNAALTSLGLDNLISVDGNFIIRDNVTLPTSIAEDLRDRITIGGSDITICSNLNGKPCP